MVERSLGILLARGRATADSALALALARAARERGTSVRLFLMWDGVDLLGGEEVVALAADGVDVAVCSQTAIGRRMPDDRPGVDYASQYTLASFVASCDRFVSLT